MTPFETLEHSDKSLVYDALADERRRYVLQLLDEAEAPLTLDDVATEVVRWERETEDGSVDAAAVTRVHTSLYHVHVPKLVDAGIVRYTGTEDRVELTDSVSLDAIDALAV